MTNRDRTSLLIALLASLTCLFGSSWVAVDLRHAAKVTLAVLAFLFGLFFVGYIAALVMEDEE